MEKEQAHIRIELTEEQTGLIKEASGKTISVLEFTAQELEARIVPTSLNFSSVTYTNHPQ